jgi:hypothetical protein
LAKKSLAVGHSVIYQTKPKEPLNQSPMLLHAINFRWTAPEKLEIPGR